MGFFSRLFSGSSKEEAGSAPTRTTFKQGDWTIERVRKQGINPAVRNSDDDYYAVANVHAANPLARDCH